jgi:hypothetical protein
VPFRAPGLQHLRYVDGLEQVFKNEQATIFEVVGTDDPQ